MRVFFAAMTFLFSFAACAESEAPKTVYKEGTHYVALESPVRTRDANKIEITEVFWYGCGHCYTFEALLHPWQKNLAEDVDYQSSPAMWNQDMTLHARAFYTAKALGVLDKMHSKIFSAMHVANDKLKSEHSIAKLFAKNGVDLDKFTRTFNSFGINSQVKQAEARARGYKITGTPEMIVDGKYRVSGRTAGSHEDMLKVVDFLIEKVRADKS